VNGQALVFDGAYTAVTLPPNVANNNAFTFAGWIYWNGGPSFQRIFDFGNSTTDYLFLTPSSSSGTLRFGIKNGGGTQIVETSALTSGQWQHVAITLSGTTARLYVNGVQAAANTSMSITPANFSPRVNRLGMSQYVGDPMFNGMMDDVLITDYALSALQISRLQTNTPPQFTNNIFARGTATEGQNYSNSIAGTATDPDAGDTLTYSKAVGPAWLSVATDGTLTGVPTSGDGGTNYITVRATDAAGQNGFALVTIYVITITGSGTWVSDASANWGDAPRWSGNIVATGAGQTANFSTINITGNRTVTLDTSRTIGTLKFSDTSGSQTWTITNNGAASLKLDTGSSSSPSIVVTNTVAIRAPVTGTNGFIKSGPGTLILSGDNSLSGPVYLDTSSSSKNDGIVRITGPQALANASTIAIRNNNSGNSTFQLDGSAGSITIDALVSATCRLNSVVTIENMAGTNIFNGDIHIYEGGNAYTVQSDSGLIVFTGSTMYVGSLTGIRTNYYTGAGSHLLVGPVLNSTNGSPCSLTKSGSGTLTLQAVNTYGNGTTLIGGTMIVNGSLPAGLFDIGSGATLGGSGVINCPVSLPSGATLTPGDSIGTLTVSNSVTLQPGSTTRIELNKATGTNDQLYVVGSLTYGGTLIVTNVDGTLWAGDAFQIFSANSTSGNFSATNLPALPNGFLWQWTPATGTLSIISTVALNPMNVTAVPNGSTLELSWPSDHTGWRVETNAVDITDTNSWFTLPGSTTTNQVFIPINPTSSQVFFRLRFP
jgi:autotransporter-associated beta strand protein